MARLGTSFDATGVEPLTPLEVLPAGRYAVQIVASEMRVTRNGDGQFLWLMLDILDGPYQGRKLFDQLNLVNQNATTVEMAQRTLSSICHATGQLQVTDSDQLHLVPMTVSVTVEPPKNGYGEKNRLRYLVPDAAAKQPLRTVSPARPPQPAPTASPPPRPQAAPWKRAG